MRNRRGTADGFREGRGFSRADWEAVSDNPEISELEMKEFRRFREVFRAGSFD
ncbi:MULTISPECIES: hypothetical protein [unclassified Rhizobium]|uniref:hypothetical protein n=1 Tax=unclassified Rhizobium TaxID=2613769 RepID=UPI000B1B6D33|nr:MULTISPECIES: hypothetical protein [unclassified Rhizobium]